MNEAESRVVEMPKLSIVIGANNARSTIRECLTVLQNQLTGGEVEIIVVDNSTDGATEIVSKQFPGVRLIRSPESAFIPELWEIGINHSMGEIVALTTAHCVPKENWLAEISQAHDSFYPGIGGAIEIEESSGWIDWAVYFCRYSRYMLPFAKERVTDFAADNASYKRWALESCREQRRKGFWEPFIHAELIRAGYELLLSPEIVVYHKRSFSLPGFMEQRFWHGRQFGSERTANLSLIKRLIYIMAAPLIPVLFLWRIIRRALAKKRHIGKLLLCSPLLILFLLCWATGEASGYLYPQKETGKPLVEAR